MPKARMTDVARDKVVSLTAAFRRDRRANVTIFYAFAIVPTIVLVGIGTDWYQQQSYKKRLDSAADAAAVAAIATAKAYLVANPQDSNVVSNAIAAGKTQAQKTFTVNAGSALLSVPVTSQSTGTCPTPQGQSNALNISFPQPINNTYTATVCYSTSMKTNFGRLAGTPTFNVNGSSTSSMTIGQYIDFYVAVDVSGSMGIPTTTDGQNALAQINPDNKSNYPTGCVFACHYANNQGYNLAKDPSNNIALRVDTVGQALNAMLQTAASTEKSNGIANEYRIGLYPYIVHAIDAAPLSADFTKATTVAGNLGSTYLDQGWGSNAPTSSNGTAIGSGGTHFENLQNDISSYIKSPFFGSGQTASSPKMFFFLVTDGVDNDQTYPFNGSKPQLPNTSFCDAAKFYGITVSVLYIPYVPIANPNPSFAGNEDGKVNALLQPQDQAASTLKSCASTGFFFTANSPSDINNAMQSMFFQAVRAARLTQ